MRHNSPNPANRLVVSGVILGVAGLGLVGIAILIQLLIRVRDYLAPELTNTLIAPVAICAALIPAVAIVSLTSRSIWALNYQATLRHFRVWDDIRSALFWLLIPILGMGSIVLRPRLETVLPQQHAISVILSWAPEFSAWCAVVSVLAFLQFGADKYVAIKRETKESTDRRTPEKTLISFAFWGGWPGAFAAMAAFHHKTADISFQRGIGASLAMHFAIVAMLTALVGFTNNHTPKLANPELKQWDDPETAPIYDNTWSVKITPKKPHKSTPSPR